MVSDTLSVVVPTYARPEQAARLLRGLDAQTIDPARFEVIVIDDGSPQPVAAALHAVERRFPLTVLTQENAGAGAARQAGAKAARNDVLLFLDDDMEPAPDLLAQHLRAHEGHEHCAAQGRIEAVPELAKRPLFERFHAGRLAAWWDALEKGTLKLRGQNVCTGNFSVRRADFLAVGGFDVELDHSEDAELGLKLERAGIQIVFAGGARTVHRPDHESADRWLANALRYGRTELAVGRKHPWAAHADPMRYLFQLDSARSALIAASGLSPRLTAPMPGALVRAGAALERLGLRKAAVHLTGLAYSTQVYRGIGETLGSARAMGGALAAFLAKAARDPASVEGVPRPLAAAARAAEDFRADFEAHKRGEAKYGPPGGRTHLAPRLVENIGLQMVLGTRLMRFFRDAGLPLGARVVSRLMRHLYSCDLHWDAEIAPGLTIAHGIGLAWAAGARVGPGCILTHGVSLGMGRDEVTHQRGAPTLEADVHVGPGAIILGPVTIGAGTKIMPLALVTFSVPPRSIVETPRPAILRRPAPAAVPQPPRPDPAKPAPAAAS